MIDPLDIRIGMKVRYYPVLPPRTDIQPVDTEVLTAPWETDNNRWLVKVRGVSGGVALTHLDRR